MSLYEELAEMIRELAKDYPAIEFFVISEIDAMEMALPEQIDDKTGESYYEIAGFRAIPSDICEEGEVGACLVDEEERINVNRIGQA